MRKVLIAEDNVEISDMMKSYLQRAGHEVYQAFDGAQALNMAKEVKPDIALLDIMMPKIDGFSVCENLRKNMNIPIIVVSAKVSEDDKVRMFELGADDYITKPFSFKEMVMRVNAQLRRFYEFNVVPTGDKNTVRCRCLRRDSRLKSERKFSTLRQKNLRFSTILRRTKIR